MVFQNMQRKSYNTIFSAILEFGGYFENTRTDIFFYLYPYII